MRAAGDGSGQSHALLLTDRERAELERAEEVLREHGDLVAGYFDNEVDAHDDDNEDDDDEEEDDLSSFNSLPSSASSSSTASSSSADAEVGESGDDGIDWSNNDGFQ